MDSGSRLTAGHYEFPDVSLIEDLEFPNTCEDLETEEYERARQAFHDSDPTKAVEWVDQFEKTTGRIDDFMVTRAGVDIDIIFMMRFFIASMLFLRRAEMLLRAADFVAARSAVEGVLSSLTYLALEQAYLAFGVDHSWVAPQVKGAALVLHGEVMLALGWWGDAQKSFLDGQRIFLEWSTPDTEARTKILGHVTKRLSQLDALPDRVSSLDAFIRESDEAFRKSQFDVAFAIMRAGAERLPQLLLAFPLSQFSKRRRQLLTCLYRARAQACTSTALKKAKNWRNATSSCSRPSSRCGPRSSERTGHQSFFC